MALVLGSHSRLLPRLVADGDGGAPTDGDVGSIEAWADLFAGEGRAEGGGGEEEQHERDHADDELQPPCRRERPMFRPEREPLAGDSTNRRIQLARDRARSLSGLSTMYMVLGPGGRGRTPGRRRARGRAGRRPARRGGRSGSPGGRVSGDLTPAARTLAAEADEEPNDAVGADDGVEGGRRRPPPSEMSRASSASMAPRALGVAGVRGRQEGWSAPCPPRAKGGSAAPVRSCCRCWRPRAASCRQAARRGLQHLGDGVEVHLEHVVQQERRPLERGSAARAAAAGRRQILQPARSPVVGIGLSVTIGSGSQAPTYCLAHGPGRLQPVEAQAHRRCGSGTPAAPPAAPRARAPAQVRVLDHVFGLGGDPSMR